MLPPGTYSRKILRWLLRSANDEVLHDVLVLERLEQLDLTLERVEHAFLRWSRCESPDGSSTCLTAISRPVLAFMPRKTLPKEPAPRAHTLDALDLMALLLTCS